MEGETENTVDQEEITVATCDFKADEEKPWEISVLKGSLLNVLESKKKWWKVRINGGTGYVPAECVKPLKPAVSPASQPVKSGSKRHLETNHQIEPQPLSFIDANTLDSGRTSAEKLTEHLDSTLPGPDVQPLEEIPRRRSSRLAGKQEKARFKKSKLERNKCPSEGLTWKATMERAQQNTTVPTDIFHTIKNGGRTPHGPRDIIKAPGLNKISVFPDTLLKIEKVESLEQGTENHPSSPVSVSCSEPLSESHLEFETRVVKEEVDLEDFPRHQFSTPCPDEPKYIASNCVLESTPIQAPNVRVYKKEVVADGRPWYGYVLPKKREYWHHARV